MLLHFFDTSRHCLAAEGERLKKLFGSEAENKIKKKIVNNPIPQASLATKK